MTSINLYTTVNKIKLLPYKENARSFTSSLNLCQIMCLWATL